MRDRQQVKTIITLTGSYADRKINSSVDAELRERILMSLLADVSDVFEVPLKTTLSSDRQPLAVLVRGIFYLVARVKTDYGLVPIANTVGGRNHASAIFQLRKIQGYLNRNNVEFLTLWSHYLTKSKLFTPKDFIWTELNT